MLIILLWVLLALLTLEELDLLVLCVLMPAITFSHNYVKVILNDLLWCGAFYLPSGKGWEMGGWVEKLVCDYISASVHVDVTCAGWEVLWVEGKRQGRCAITYIIIVIRTCFLTAHSVAFLVFLILLKGQELQQGAQCPVLFWVRIPWPWGSWAGLPPPQPLFKHVFRPHTKSIVSIFFLSTAWY